MVRGVQAGVKDWAKAAADSGSVIFLVVSIKLSVERARKFQNPTLIRIHTRFHRNRIMMRRSATLQHM